MDYKMRIPCAICYNKKTQRIGCMYACKNCINRYAYSEKQQRLGMFEAGLVYLALVNNVRQIVAKEESTIKQFKDINKAKRYMKSLKGNDYLCPSLYFVPYFCLY